MDDFTVTPRFSNSTPHGLTVQFPPLSPSNNSVILDLDSDDEYDDCRVRQRKHDLSSYPKGLLGRPIAGCKRVADSHNTKPFPGPGSLFQSITATPALAGFSFEELRLECYSQSLIASGERPPPVDLAKEPWAAIPPTFRPFLSYPLDHEMNRKDVTMVEDASGP